MTASTAQNTPEISLNAESPSAQPQWIDLDGVVNMRDLGGITTASGQAVRPRRLIRSDNLQDLSDADVRWLLDDAGVSDVVDLRTGLEVRSEGPGPLTYTGVAIHHLSLYPEGAQETGIPDDDDEGTETENLDLEELPWLADRPDPELASDHHEEFLTTHYLQYLNRRPDNVVAALRVIGQAKGAVIVHCAAGKDRTGTITALALRLVGVPIASAAADYQATNERLSQILDRLRATATYAADLDGQDESTQRTDATIMTDVLTYIDQRWGGVEPYLRRHGWTDADTTALRTRLLFS